MTSVSPHDRRPARGSPGGLARRLWQRLKATAFPTGAITFHLGVWTRRRITDADGDEVRRLADRHGLAEILVLHGNSLEIGGRAVLVTGPSGIGKSTACQIMGRRGLARTIEDGLVLVGVCDGRWVVIETGTLPVLRSASNIRRRLGPWLGLGASRSAPAPCAAGDRARPATTPVHTLAFRLAVLHHAGRPAGFCSRVYEVALLAVAATPSDPFPSLRLAAGGSLEVIHDLLALAPAGLRTTVIMTPDGPREIAEQIVRACLDRDWTHRLR